MMWMWMWMWFIKLLQKRPSDNAIRIGRIIFWLVFSWLVYYSFYYSWRELQDNLFWFELSANWMMFLKCFIIFLGFIPFIIWLTNVCLLKSKYMRIIQIVFWILLFYVSSLYESIADLWVDTFIFIIAFLPLIAWITWKCITTKCLRYWQKLTKIRV